MKKLKLLFASLALLVGSGTAWAQTDVTSTYLTNANFETDDALTGDYLYGYGKDGTPYGFQTITGWTSVVTAGDNSNAKYPNSGTAAGVFGYGSPTQLKGNAKAAPATNPDGEATGKCFGFFGVWGCGGYYYQNVTLAAGKYTITVPMYNQSGTQANTTYTGFFPTSGTNRTVAVNPTVGQWVNQTVTFTLANSTEGQIRIGYQSTGSGSGANPMLFIDCVKIEFTALVIKDVLETALTAATHANATLSNSELTAAIASAQTVYDDEDATQDQVNSAAATLNAAVELAMSAAGDVTGIFLSNPGFESCTVTTTNAAAGGDASPLNIEGGWSQTSSAAWSSSAVVSYGGDGQVNGVKAPSADNAGDEGNALGVSVGWGGTVTYQSAAVTLPAGVYTLQVYAYNAFNDAQQFASKFGFVPTDGEATLSSKNSFTKNTWETDKVTFTLNEATEGKIQVGGQAISGGSSANAKVFFDNITITYKSFLAGAKEAWDEAVADAEAAKTECPNVTGEELTALNAELAKAEPTTVAGYDEATEALNAATSTFTAAKASYDAYVAELTIATNVGVTSLPDAPTTAAEALETVNPLKVAEYNYVIDKYDTDGSALFIPSWEKSNFDALSNEHWSAKTSEYFDKWSGSAFTSKIYKTVTLPEGHYAFYAAARGQAGASTATLKVSYGETNLSVPYNIKGNRGYGINTSGAADFSSSSAYACNNEGFGWEWRFITFDLAAETEVTLSIEGSGNNSWVSAGDTKLLTYDNIAVTRQIYQAALDAAKAYQDVDMFTEDKESLNTAITNNTLAVASATKEELIAATDNLNAAKDKAVVDAARYATYSTVVTTIDGGTNVDLTSLIGNPSFESTAAYALVGDGWTNEGVGIQGQTNSGFDGYRVGSVFAERWTGSGSIEAFKTYQTISALPAGIYEVSAVATFNGAGATLFANSTTTAISDAGTYKTVIEIADKGSIELGVQAVAPTGSWFKADNFQLKYLGTIDDLTYTLAKGKMGTDKSAAQTAAETTFLGSKTLDNYNALLAAIAEAEASVANYAALKAAIDKANAEKDANNFVTTAATTTFEGVIATATAAWNDVTYTDQQAKNAVGTLKNAACNYMGSAWITPDPKPEVWWYFNTWSTEGDTDGTDFFNPFFENFKPNTENLPNNTFTAQLTGLANGTYNVEVWARVQRRSTDNFDADSKITMNVNGGDAVSLMNGSTKVNEGTNDEMRLGRFTATGEVTDGTLTLTINVATGSNVHWLSWRDVKYTIIDESVAVTAAGYATYVSDNDLDYTSVEGLTAYKATVEGSTINFEKVTTVPAGEGVLLKGEAKDYAVPVTAGIAAWAANDNAFIRGTGAAVETGDGPYNYILNNVGGVVGFYKAAGQTVAMNRAYIQAPVSAARLSFIFDDEETTGINVVNALTSGKAEIYNAKGVKIDRLQKGMNIIKMNGKIQKVMVK